MNTVSSVVENIENMRTLQLVYSISFLFELHFCCLRVVYSTLWCYQYESAYFTFP